MFLKVIVFCFVLLFVMEFIDETSALSEGAEGVCVGKISTKKIKKVYSTKYSNKWCGKKKCVVRMMRNQPYVVTSNVMMCCSGYQYQSAEDVCVPLCSTGCLGGRCIAPERCQCDPPTTLDPEHPNTCLSTICDPPCVNAECTGNNTCTCKQDFDNYNATHCYKCDAGYSIDSNFKCVPNCKCINGTCTAPGICSCSPGFILQNTTCVPKCEGCVNATCVSPNTCDCLNGFSKINDTHCEPICDDCDSGVCVSPGVCECEEGFSKVNGTCEPICSRSCVNGVCSGPDFCTCYEGYQKNKTEQNVCLKPDDDCEGPCELHGEGICESIIR